MSEVDREATRRRLKIWQEAQLALDEQRWRELKALSNEKALVLSRALLGRPGVVSAFRHTSGLVEQQTLFAKMMLTEKRIG